MLNKNTQHQIIQVNGGLACGYLYERFSKLPPSDHIQKKLNHTGFKFEPIVNRKRKVLGFEVLIDRSKYKQTPQDTSEYLVSSSWSFSAGLVKRQLDFIRERYKQIDTQSVFVNLERNNLCDMTLLNEICDTNRFLSSHNIQLVMEITERNHCYSCPEVMKGLLFLKHNNVLMAADDYVWWQDDFRRNEVAAGIYGIVKIENPIQWIKHDINYCVDTRLEVFRATIETMLENRNVKIIIERIENEEEFVLLSGLPVSGFQGYLFGQSDLK